MGWRYIIDSMRLWNHIDFDNDQGIQIIVSLLMAAHRLLHLTYLIKQHVFERYTLLRRALRIPNFWTIQIEAISSCIAGPFCNMLARRCKPSRGYALVNLASDPYLTRRTIHPRLDASNPTSHPRFQSVLPFDPTQGFPANFAFEIRTRSH